MDNLNNTRLVAVLFTALSTALIFACLPFSKVSFTLEGLGAISYLLTVFLLASAYCWRRRMDPMAAALEASALGIFITVPILVSTYLAASLGRPLADEWLMQADAAFGFDWHAFIAFVDARPNLARILAYGYSALAIELLLLPIILGLSRRIERAYLMIVAYGILCYAASVISIWYPAIGGYAHYGIARGDLASINAHYGFAFLRDFAAVRDDPQFVLSLLNAAGIITFPSVHAGGALLCAWAAWDVKPLRYPMVAVNVIVAMSAISHGSHYLVDVIAGFAVAALSIALASAMLRHAWLGTLIAWKGPGRSELPALTSGNPSRPL